MYLSIVAVILDQFEENVYLLEKKIYVQKNKISPKTLKYPLFCPFLMSTLGIWLLSGQCGKEMI